MIKLDFLEFVLKVDFEIEEFSQFKKEIAGLRGCLKTNYFYDINNVSKFCKNRDGVLDFLTKYKKLIEQFIETDTLDYALTFSEYEMDYHFDEYKTVLMEVRRVGEEKTRLVIDKLTEFGFKKFNFGRDILKDMYYENFHKKYNSDLYELTYYFTDGSKEYLATYFGDSFPVVIKDANILIEYRDANVFHNGMDIFISSFDIDFNKIPKDWSNQSIVNLMPFDEIKKITNMCWTLRNIDKVLESLNVSVKRIGELRTYDDLHEFYKKQLNFLLEQIDKLNLNRQEVVCEYVKLGYSEEYFDTCLKYLERAEENAKFDPC